MPSAVFSYNTLGQRLFFGSGIAQYKYGKIVGTIDTNTVIEQRVTQLFIVNIHS